MNIRKATRKYEGWLAKRITLVQADLDLKHRYMAGGLFPFLRATFYRWVQVWPEACPDLAKAPAVLAVGDLHVENFGTWRDIEGRLIWGVNDFDEACVMPYTNDLVRLATSAELAISTNHLSINPRDACKSILAGYTEALAAGGRAFVLAEHHPVLRDIAASELRDPVRFWEKLNAWPVIRRPPPPGVVKSLERLLPERGLPYHMVHRVAGLGSLGRQRFVAIAEWRGGKVAREAKALVAPAWSGSKRILYQKILDASVRCPDPFVHLCGSWIVRRLAPDCSRIELASLPGSRDEVRLLYAMGWETANIHLGSGKVIKAVRRDLGKRPVGWLYTAVRQMRKAVTGDWKEWKKELKEPSSRSARSPSG